MNANDPKITDEVKRIALEMFHVAFNDRLERGGVGQPATAVTHFDQLNPNNRHEFVKLALWHLQHRS